VGDGIVEVEWTDATAPLDLGEDATKVVVSHSPGR
jgi:hypothetical protein